MKNKPTSNIAELPIKIRDWTCHQIGLCANKKNSFRVFV